MRLKILGEIATYCYIWHILPRTDNLMNLSFVSIITWAGDKPVKVLKLKPVYDKRA